MTIQKESESNISKAQEFYSSVEYYAQIQPQDIVFSAYDDENIVGVVRLTPENNTLVLRGMMVSKSHQRKGIGSLMLKELEKAIDEQDCYCIPHDWLEGFYGQIGFVKVNDVDAPPHLQERILENRKKYPHLIMMKRLA